jgi:hypothetical protein
MVRRWVAWWGSVAVVLTLAGTGVAAAAPVGGSPPLPPANSCVAPLLPCYILLSISSGSHGNQETVTGTNFWPGEPYTVYFWNGTPGATAAVVAYGSTGTGGFSTTFRIPKDPVGNYTVFVTDFAGDNQSGPFHLTALTASPDSATVGNITSVSGQGFLPAHVVEFHVHGLRALTVGRCATNTSGSFTGCSVKVPHAPSGSTELTATDGTYIARISFDVS